MESRFNNIKKMQNVFLNCYYDTPNTNAAFKNLVNSETTDFSRYTFFYANYLIKKESFKKANSILTAKLDEVPRNLLLNQLYSDINFDGLIDIFDLLQAIA